jgi:hypothetical protein
LLYFNGASHSPIDAAERNEKRVATGLDQLTAELADGRIDQSIS